MRTSVLVTAATIKANPIFVESCLPRPSEPFHCSYLLPSPAVPEKLYLLVIKLNYKLSCCPPHCCLLTPWHQERASTAEGGRGLGQLEKEGGTEGAGKSQVPALIPSSSFIRHLLGTQLAAAVCGVSRA